MSKPRVFISSTFYDLQPVRAELESFIVNMGYDPVMFERGHVPYVRDKTLERSCYREVSNCDMLLAIVGGRFGASSDDPPYSISQKEIKQALEDNKQVYVFIAKSVHIEYDTYMANKGHEIAFRHVDDVRVYRFIEEVRALPINNPIFPFEIARDIVSILREQWAGLFKGLLEQQAELPKNRAIAELEAAADSLNQLVNYLVAEQQSKDETVQHILVSSHPVFGRLAKLLGARYRVYFTTRTEMEAWLSARRYLPTYDPFSDEPCEFYTYADKDDSTELRVAAALFDGRDKLKPMSQEEWDDTHAETYKGKADAEEYDPWAET